MSSLLHHATCSNGSSTTQQVTEELLKQEGSWTIDPQGGKILSPNNREQQKIIDDPFLLETETSQQLGHHHHQQPNRRRRQKNNFLNSKNQCLGKRDKSSAGRLDPGVIEICDLINTMEMYYTTSSCAGRCFLYTGDGIKSTNSFVRYRVSHSGIADAQRYFNMKTLLSQDDPTGGGDPILVEFDGGRRLRQQLKHEQQQFLEANDEADLSMQNEDEFQVQMDDVAESFQHIWLRYEPFILHVACCSLTAAAMLMAVARPTFKNVGLTTWKDDTKYLVAIWGDEGLEMPLTNQDGDSMISSSNGFSAEWVARLVNERHERNAAKINRLAEAIRNMPPISENHYNNDNSESDNDDDDVDDSTNQLQIPRSFDVIGDVALIHSLLTEDHKEQEEIGLAILNKNKAIKVVALRNTNLSGTERAPGSLRIIAGCQRSPLITTHKEYGIACMVDLEHTFFSPRMGPERLRICQQTARGEHILVLFAGVGMEALQLAARTEAASITAVELNEVAAQCAQRSHKLLERNRVGVKSPGAHERLRIIQGDCLAILPTLPRNYYHRVLAPRPKEGNLDGNQPDTISSDNTQAGGAEFLAALLPVLLVEGGRCHWYDFAATHEFPKCERTVKLLSHACAQNGMKMNVLHVSNAGSVAKRQLRVCVDFQVASLQ